MPPRLTGRDIRHGHFGQCSEDCPAWGSLQWFVRCKAEITELTNDMITIYKSGHSEEAFQIPKNQ